MAKEFIIANLRKQLSELDSVGKNIGSLSNEINEIIEELEDESKLGAPAQYDFGKEKISKSKRTIIKEVKKNIKTLQQITASIENIQKESTKQITSQIEKVDKD